MDRRRGHPRDGPPVFDDISKFIASRFARRATVGEHVGQVKLVGLTKAVFSGVSPDRPHSAS